MHRRHVDHLVGPVVVVSDPLVGLLEHDPHEPHGVSPLERVVNFQRPPPVPKGKVKQVLGELLVGEVGRRRGLVPVVEVRRPLGVVHAVPLKQARPHEGLDEERPWPTLREKEPVLVVHVEVVHPVLKRGHVVVVELDDHGPKVGVVRVHLVGRPYVNLRVQGPVVSPEEALVTNKREPGNRQRRVVLGGVGQEDRRGPGN